MTVKKHFEKKYDLSHKNQRFKKKWKHVIIGLYPGFQACLEIATAESSVFAPFLFAYLQITLHHMPSSQDRSLLAHKPISA